MQNNPEIEQIIEAAVKMARGKQHEYVLTEHVLLAMIRHIPFRRVLEKFGTDLTMFEMELDKYLDSLLSLVKADKDVPPKKTNALERSLTEHSHRCYLQVDDQLVYWIYTWP